MALQSTDNFIVNRSGVSYKVPYSQLVIDVDNDITVTDAFTTTGDPITAVQSIVPYTATFGIRLPTAGTNDFNVEGSLRYNESSGKIELYDNGAWVTASGTTAFGDIPPTTASVGDVWYDTSNGRAYVYYNDGDSVQWVEMNPSWNGSVPIGSVEPDRLSTGGPNWNTNGDLTVIRDVNVGRDVNISSGNALNLVTNNFNHGLKVNADVDMEIFVGATKDIRFGSMTDNGETFTNRMSLNANGYLGIATDDAITPVEVKTANVDGYSISIDNDGPARYHLTNQAGTEWLMGQKASDNANFMISKEVSGTETDYITLYQGGRIDISATGAGQDLYLRAADHIVIESGEEEDGAIYFRGSSGSDTYRFSKSGQTEITGSLSMESLTASRIYTFPDTSGTVALTSSKVDDADKLDGISSGSFLRSDANDTASGEITFDGRVNIRGHIDLSDNEYLYFGSSDDVEFFCNGSHMYMDLNSGIGNFYIRDGSTTRYTFDDNGTLTCGTVIANLDRTKVNNAISGTTSGTVGSYNLLQFDGSQQAFTPNSTISGGSLRYTNCGGNRYTGSRPGGSYRLLGRLGQDSSVSDPERASLFVRYA